MQKKKYKSNVLQSPHLIILQALYLINNICAYGLIQKMVHAMPYYILSYYLFALFCINFSLSYCWWLVSYETATTSWGTTNCKYCRKEFYNIYHWAEAHICQMSATGVCDCVCVYCCWYEPYGIIARATHILDAPFFWSENSTENRRKKSENQQQQ